MKEPKRIRLSDFDAKQKEPHKRPLKSVDTKILELYDDFGYITSVEIKNTDDENNSQNNS